jgi:hypothetical protein
MQPYRRPEGSGFPGASILAAGVMGALVVVGAAARRGHRKVAPPRWARYVNVTLAVAAMACAAAWAWLLVWQGGVYRSAFARLTVKRVGDVGWETLGLIGIALVVSGSFRRFLRQFLTSRGGFLLLAWVAAVVLAFGPEIRVQGKAIGAGPYLWLYQHVPGFDGFRVPARFFMVASFFLAALGGIAVAWLARKNRAAGIVAAAVLVTGIVIEGRVAPFIMSKPLWVDHYELPETTFPVPPNLGAVYDTVTALPAGTVLAELPFGSDPFDIRSMYFAGYHRKPIVNGFSGFFPTSYLMLRSHIEADPADKAAAWKALLDAGVTHVVVHEQPWRDQKGPKMSAWIRDAGGREIAAAGTDRLFAIR